MLSRTMKDKRAKRKGKVKGVPNTKPMGPKVTKRRLRRAIEGTFGVKSQIARRLGVTSGCLYGKLKKWPDMAALVAEESKRLVDVAEGRLETLVRQDDNLGVSLRAAMFIMDCYGDKSPSQTLKLEGGRTPIQLQAAISAGIPATALELPVDVKKRLLDLYKNKAPKTPQPHHQVKISRIRRKS